MIASGPLHYLTRPRVPDDELSATGPLHYLTQPRVPAGNPDGGQWTTEGRNSAIRLASNEISKLGRQMFPIIATEAAKRLVDAYRSGHLLKDLFGQRPGTVEYTNLDGKDIFGSSSTLPSYTREDRLAAEQLRDSLIEKYPAIMKGEDAGQRPNDSLFHAETTVLLRAAKSSGGSLKGRSLEIHIDRPMCPGCDKVLPLVGEELGNPTVTFIGPGGRMKTMHNGTWTR